MLIVSGAHGEPMEREGAYWALVSTQEKDETEAPRFISLKTTSSDHNKGTKKSRHRTESGEGGRQGRCQSVPGGAQRVQAAAGAAPELQPHGVDLLRSRLLCTILAGLCMPYLAVLLVDAMLVFACDDHVKMMGEVKIACFHFVGVGIVQVPQHHRLRLGQRCAERRHGQATPRRDS